MPTAQPFLRMHPGPSPAPFHPFVYVFAHVPPTAAMHGFHVFFRMHCCVAQPEGKGMKEIVHDFALSQENGALESRLVLVH